MHTHAHIYECVSMSNYSFILKNVEFFIYNKIKAFTLKKKKRITKPDPQESKSNPQPVLLQSIGRKPDSQGQA